MSATVEDVMATIIALDENLDDAVGPVEVEPLALRAVLDAFKASVNLEEVLERERDEARANLERAIAAAGESDTKFVAMQRRAIQAEAQRDALARVLRSPDFDLVLRIAEGYMMGDPPRTPDPVVRTAAANIRRDAREALAAVEDS